MIFLLWVFAIASIFFLACRFEILANRDFNYSLIMGTGGGISDFELGSASAKLLLVMGVLFPIGIIIFYLAGGGEDTRYLVMIYIFYVLHLCERNLKATNKSVGIYGTFLIMFVCFWMSLVALVGLGLATTSRRN